MELLTHNKKGSIELLQGEAEVKAKSEKKAGLVIASIILLIGCLIAFGIWGYASFQQLSLNQIKNEIEKKMQDWQAMAAVGTQVKNISAKDQIISQTNTKYSGLDEKLDKIRGLLPQGVSLVTLSLDSTGKVVLAGKSADAAVVYQFYELLKADKEIKTPVLSSLGKKTEDYDFNITFTLVAK